MRAHASSNHDIADIPSRIARFLGGEVPQIAHQTFPPTHISGIDAEFLLHSWGNGEDVVRTKSASKAVVLEQMFFLLQRQMCLRKAA